MLRRRQRLLDDDAVLALHGVDAMVDPAGMDGRRCLSPFPGWPTCARHAWRVPPQAACAAHRCGVRRPARATSSAFVSAGSVAPMTPVIARSHGKPRKRIIREDRVRADMDDLRIRPRRLVLGDPGHIGFEHDDHVGHIEIVFRIAARDASGCSTACTCNDACARTPEWRTVRPAPQVSRHRIPRGPRTRVMISGNSAAASMSAASSMALRVGKGGRRRRVARRRGVAEIR